MHPYIIRFGHFGIPGYGLMLGIGFLVALWFAGRILRRRPVPGASADVILDTATIAFLAGIAGGRLFYVFLNFRHYAENPLAVFKIWEGGLVLYGGVLLGLMVGVLLLRRRNIPVLPVLDRIAPPVAAALAFGRIGCFLNGCCYGVISHGWGVCFPKFMDVGPGGAREITGSPAFLDHLGRGLLGQEAVASLPVLPTQLMEAAFAAGLALFLHMRLSRSRRDGGTFAAFLGLYAAWRFCLEFARGDNPSCWGPLTFSQGISLAVLAGVLALVRHIGRRKGIINSAEAP
ncbi:MAG: prolipoprotein diacylglyceryl transferase [Planctomycetota bacterium]